jgi:hypothetical protein
MFGMNFDLYTNI